MAVKKKSGNAARPERRMDRTGSERNLLASMQACRAALGMYLAQSRGKRGGKAICTAARVSRASLTNLEISKGKVSKNDVAAVMDALTVPQGKQLALLYARLTKLIGTFDGTFE